MSRLVFLLFGLCIICSNRHLRLEPEILDITSDVLTADDLFNNGDLMYIDMPESINAVGTSLASFENEEKLVIRGRISKADSKTGAENVFSYHILRKN